MPSEIEPSCFQGISNRKSIIEDIPSAAMSTRSNETNNTDSTNVIPTAVISDMEPVATNQSSNGIFGNLAAMSMSADNVLGTPRLSLATADEDFQVLVSTLLEKVRPHIPTKCQLTYLSVSFALNYGKLEQKFNI